MTFLSCRSQPEIEKSLTHEIFSRDSRRSSSSHQASYTASSRRRRKVAGDPITRTGAPAVSRLAQLPRDKTNPAHRAGGIAEIPRAILVGRQILEERESANREIRGQLSRIEPKCPRLTGLADGLKDLCTSIEACRGVEQPAMDVGEEQLAPRSNGACNGA